jgi:hypothetical protein
MQASVPHAFAQRAPFVGSEEVDDDWTPRAQNFTQQQPLLQQQQLHVLRLQQEELDFEAGVAEDRRSNLAAISKDAAQVRVLDVGPAPKLCSTFRQRDALHVVGV